MGRINAKKQGGLIPIHSESVSQESRHYILLPHAAHANLQILFEIIELKIIRNVPKDPLHSHPDLAHGHVVGLHLWGDLGAAKKTLEMGP